MKFKRTEPSIPEPDMTPMIDIVFQLIAFFMLVTNFDQAQADERVTLPVDRLAKPPKTARTKEILVNIGYLREKGTGNKLDPNPFVFQVGQKYRIAEYGKLLATESRLVIKQHGEEAIKEYSIVIRADSEVPFGMIQELIKLAQKSKYEKFSLKAMIKVLE